VTPIQPTSGDGNEEWRRDVVEVRAAVQKLLAGLEERGEALVVLVSGVIVVNESFAEASAAWKRVAVGGPADEHAVRGVYAPAHECVHLIQLLTTRYLLSMFFELANLIAFTNKHRGRNTPYGEWLAPTLESYERVQIGLTARKSKFSTLQVIETHAVLEGFRGFASRHVADGLDTLMQLAHGNDRNYVEVIKTTWKAHGFELMFETLPKLCWLALNVNDPGRWLSDALEQLSNDDIRFIASASAVETCRAFNFEPIEASRSWRLRRPEISTHPLHKLLSPYFDTLERESNPEFRLQRAMHPGRVLYGAADYMPELMPRLAVYADDRYILNGPAKNEGSEVAHTLVRLSALACRTLAWLGDPNRDAKNTD
jgi:hypothetical protein